jgi:hypothetical protein
MWTPHRFFTPEEANATLPDVAPLALRAQALVQRFEEVAENPTARDRVNRELANILVRLDGLGVSVRGLAQGLIDFPGLRNGRLVALSWQVGESGVSWWMPVDAPIPFRQPIRGTAPATWAWYD